VPRPDGATVNVLASFLEASLDRAAAAKPNPDAKSKAGFTPLDIALGKDSFGLPVPHESTVALL
jgi:hypothetical protein